MQTTSPSVNARSKRCLWPTLSANISLPNGNCTLPHIKPPMAVWDALLHLISIAVILYVVSAHVYREWPISRAAMNSTLPIETFILDFDGTITKTDTINAILKSVLAVQDARGKDMSRAWKEIVESYSKDYQAYIQSYRPTEEERTTAEEEIQFYRSVGAVEEKSFNRVSNSGVFSGIGEQKLEELGSQAVRSGDVMVQEGFEEFLQSLNKSNMKWAVVSVNFSSAFIKGVLSSVRLGSNITVLANQPDEHGVLKGPKGRVMTTSDAKLEAALGLIGPRDAKATNKVVYIGDSGTDLKCLLADGVIGLVISEDGRSNLLKTMRRIKMNVLHVAEYDEKVSKAVYWARDYLEIIQSPLLS